MLRAYILIWIIFGIGYSQQTSVANSIDYTLNDYSVLIDTLGFEHVDSLRKVEFQKLNDLQNHHSSDSLPTSINLRKIEILDEIYRLNLIDINSWRSVLTDYVKSNPETASQINSSFSTFNKLAINADSIHVLKKDEINDSLKLMAWQSLTFMQSQAIDGLSELYRSKCQSTNNTADSLRNDNVIITDTVKYQSSIVKDKAPNESLLISPYQEVSIDTIKIKPVKQDNSTDELHFTNTQESRQDSLLLLQQQVESQTSDTLDAKATEQFLTAVYTSDTVRLRNLITGFDKESLLKTWELYRRMRAGVISPTEALADSRNDSAQLTVLLSNINSNDTLLEKTNISANNLSPQNVNEFIQQFAAAENQHSTDSLGNDQIYFVVQIAACRQPLSKHYLNAIYKGSDSIEMRNEEDWYKYQISRTNDYRKVLETLHESNVKGAFVVAYLKNEKLSLWNVLHQSHDANLVINGGLGNDPLVFVIQILASRQPVSESELHSVYKGIWPLRLIEEDQWFKYQMVIGPSYKIAKERCKSLNIEGSFVVAYFNGKKITTKEALDIVKRNKSNK